MCGIAGILCFESGGMPLSPHLNAMTNSMIARGPDDEGFALLNLDDSLSLHSGPATPRSLIDSGLKNLTTSPLYTKPVRLGLGHRRLSIIDTSTGGHQPMVTTEGKQVIVFNGEIYNFQELRVTLENAGHRFRTHSDTEVLLTAYQHWGDSCVTHFNGDFAFAIWDKKRKQLFCARDRIGIKPFYYFKTSSFFVFGSDIKTLIASGLYTPQPDSEGLFLAMGFGIAPRPKTAFDGIYALEQGHTLNVTPRGQLEHSRYWSIPTNIQNQKMTHHEAIDLVDHHLHAAVSRRLVADVPLACFLSGGIDSTTMTAIGSQHCDSLNAFTLGFENSTPDYDEVSEASELARRYKINHIIHQTSPDLLKDSLGSWVDGFEEPCGHVPANYLLSMAVASHGIRVALNGLGGDELFGGYHWYKLRKLPYQFVPHFFTSIAQYLPEGRLRKAVLLGRASTATQLHTLIFQRNSDDVLTKLLTPNFCPTQSTATILDKMYAQNRTFTDTVEAFNYMDLMNYVGNHHVHRTDQFTMACSIEGRFPLLDHELIEAAFTIPSRYKIRGSIQKSVLRDVAKKYLPERCLAMRKKGFTVPLNAWVNGPLKEFVTQLLSQLADRPQLNGTEIIRLRNAFVAGSLPASTAWHLSSLELWFRRFIDPGRPSVS